METGKSFENINQGQDAKQLLEELKSIIMSAEEAEARASKIRQQIKTKTASWYELGVSETDFEEIVRQASRSGYDAATHFDKSRFE